MAMMMVMGLMLVMLLLAYVVETAVEFLFGELFTTIMVSVPHTRGSDNPAALEQICPSVYNCAVE